MTTETNVNNKQRIEHIDALKGFAIFCVLWGHSLQYLRNGYDFFHNPMFAFIYSFHMPLFFMVSGFFFRSSLKLNLKDFLLKKGMQLILPCVVWGVIFYLIGLVSAIFGQNEHILTHWVDELKLIYASDKWPWFLRKLFISFFIVYLSFKLFKKDWLACLLSIAFVFIEPNSGFQIVYLPMFWAGIYLKNNYPFISKHVKQILLFSAVIFAVCLLFWDGSYHIKGFPVLLEIKTLSFNFTDIYIPLFRLLTGIVGSLFWFMLFFSIYMNNNFFTVLGKIGVNTLAIYLLQRLILETWLGGIIDLSDMNIWIYNLIVTPLIALTVLVICMIIIKFVQRNKYAELLLFGKK